MDAADPVAVAAVLAAIASGLIPAAALIVSWQARAEARRAADAAEESARQARRSADADERAVALSQHEAEQRASERHRDDGPTFERVSGDVDDEGAYVELRMVGGPGAVVLTVQVGALWCDSIAAPGDGQQARSSTATYPAMHPGETFAVIARLHYDKVNLKRPPTVLPLIINIRSCEDKPRKWLRHVPVELVQAGPWFEDAP